eukprot:2352515-Rhodomonas_salina.1
MVMISTSTKTSTRFHMYWKYAFQVAAVQSRECISSRDMSVIEWINNCFSCRGGVWACGSKPKTKFAAKNEI